MRKVLVLLLLGSIMFNATACGNKIVSMDNNDISNKEKNTTLLQEDSIKQEEPKEKEKIEEHEKQEDLDDLDAFIDWQMSVPGVTRDDAEELKIENMTQLTYYAYVAYSKDIEFNKYQQEKNEEISIQMSIENLILNKNTDITSDELKELEDLLGVDSITLNNEKFTFYFNTKDSYNKFVELMKEDIKYELSNIKKSYNAVCDIDYNETFTEFKVNYTLNDDFKKTAYLESVHTDLFYREKMAEIYNYTLRYYSFTGKFLDNISIQFIDAKSQEITNTSDLKTFINNIENQKIIEEKQEKINGNDNTIG